jgi:hypothetical protein
MNHSSRPATPYTQPSSARVTPGMLVPRYSLALLGVLASACGDVDPDPLFWGPPGVSGTDGWTSDAASGEDGGAGQASQGGDGGAETGAAESAGSAGSVGSVGSAGDGDGDESSADTGSTGTAGLTGDGDGDGDGDGVACLEQSFAVEILRPQIGLVLDYSGSMDSAFNSNVTRWQALHDTTLDLFDRYSERAEFGIIVYPSETVADWCDPAFGPELEMGVHSAQAVEWAIPSRYGDPDGGTPLVNAIELAESMMLDADPARPRALVVIADGGVSTCEPGDSPETVAAVAEALFVGEQVTTFVVGIGSEADSLDPVALAGGTAAMIPVQDEPTLHAALEQIVGEAVDCELSLDAPLPGNGSLVLHLGAMEIVADPACTGDGWRETSPTTIELCGVSCDAYREGATVELELVCSAG